MQKLYYIFNYFVDFAHMLSQIVRFDYDNAGNRIRRANESGPLPVTLIRLNAT